MLLKVMQNVRCYARFTKHLKPGKDRSKPTEEFFQKISVENEVKHVQAKQETIRSRPRAMATNPMGPRPNEVNEAGLGIPLFSKMQDLDANLNRILLSVKSRNRREKNDRILLEGKRLIRDAVQVGAIPEIIIFSRVEDIKSISLPECGVKLYKVPYKTISMWSDTTTSPGIMAILKTPPVHLKKPNKNMLPLTVICDNVRDPGNLGAILRVAAGVGCEQLLLTKGCVDLWEPKVLRSAAGAHFHLPIHKNVSIDTLENFIESDAIVYVADNNASLTSNAECATHHGSFNRLIPILPYYSVDFTHPQSVVLILGGETEGLSDDAMRLASKRCGSRLHIPLTNGIESLNTATALSVILFEIKRQLCTIMKPSGNKISDDAHLPHVADERITLPNT